MFWWVGGTGTPSTSCIIARGNFWIQSELMRSNGSKHIDRSYLDHCYYPLKKKSIYRTTLFVGQLLTVSLALLSRLNCLIIDSQKPSAEILGNCLIHEFLPELVRSYQILFIYLFPPNRAQHLEPFDYETLSANGPSIPSGASKISE